MAEQKRKFHRRPKSVEERGAVSAAVVRRLPRYHRFLGELLRGGTLRISSAKLSDLMGVTASQIRQDLNCFGGFGQQGYGYSVRYLYEQIGALLGVDEGYRAVIVGAGNLGRALVSSHMFERRGVSRMAMFDIDPAVIGKRFGGIPVLPMTAFSNYVKENAIDLAVLTVSKEAALTVAQEIAAAGVRGILNFSGQELSLPEDAVVVENIHMGDSLMMLCYNMKEKREGQ